MCGAGEVVDDVVQFAVHRDGAAGFVVGLRILQLGGQILLLLLEPRNFLFDPVHGLLELAPLARTRLARFGFGALSLAIFRRRPVGGRCRARRAGGLRGGALVEVILVVAGVRREPAGVDVQDLAARACG